MATRSATKRKPQPVPPAIFPPLTAEEKARMVRHGLTAEDIERDPGLRYAGVIGDDPDFFKPLEEYYRETRGRELFSDQRH